MTKVKGYKATLWNGMPKYGCRSMPYNVGGVYSISHDIELCRFGLHFCRELCYVYGHYDSAFYTRVFEVESSGKVCFGETKMCTDRLKFVRELTPMEVLRHLVGNVNFTDTGRFARNQAMHILYSVIEWERRSTTIIMTPQEWKGMPALYLASRRLQWAQTFNKYSYLPICQAAMHDCGITKHELMTLVETLQQNPILKTNDKEDKQ